MSSDLSVTRWTPLSVNLDFDEDFLGQWSVSHGLSFNSVVLRSDEVVLFDPLFEEGVEWSDWQEQLEAGGLTPESIDALVLTDSIVGESDLWRQFLERNRRCRIFAPKGALGKISGFVEPSRVSELVDGQTVSILGHDFEIFVENVDGIGELAALWNEKDSHLLSGRWTGSWGDLDGHFVDTTVSEGERDFFLFQAHRYCVQWFGTRSQAYSRFRSWIAPKSIKTILPRHGIGWQKSVEKLLSTTDLETFKRQAPNSEFAALIYPSPELIESVHRSRASVKIFYPGDRIDEIVPELYLTRSYVLYRNEQANVLKLIGALIEHGLRDRTLIWISPSEEVPFEGSAAQALLELGWNTETVLAQGDWIQEIIDRMEL